MIELSQEQQQILNDVMGWVDDFYAGKTDKPYTTLGGVAGSGKTTVLGFIADELRNRQAYIRIGFITYTGKASIVLKGKLTEIGENDFIGTIHSLIYFPITDEYTGKIEGWSLKEDMPVNFIIVDEASMVGKDIWKDLLEYNIPIIAIGDHKQLPPVGNDKFNLMEDPEHVLTEIHRQALDNPIIQLSMVAREEGWIDYGVYGKGVAKLHWTDPRCKQIITSYNKDSDLIALCGMNRTRVQLNKMIRAKYKFKGVPKPGEKLICLKNNKNLGIMNGQLGFLQEIKKLGPKFYTLQMKMDGMNMDIWPYVLKDGFGKVSSNDVYAESNTLDIKLELGDEIEKFWRSKTPDYFMGLDEKRQMNVDLFDFGYAISVHKSQGSEWGRVIMFDERNSYQTDDDYSRWLYTGITRAREKLIIIEDF